MRLSELKTGESGVIVKVFGHGAFRKRVMEMGFVRGRKISAILSAPMRDPVKYRLMGYEVSLRRSEASMIEILPVDNDAADFSDIQQLPASGCGDKDTTAEVEFRGKEQKRETYVASPDDASRKAYEGSRHIINVALIGNPNCGKTSLFNVASGAPEPVGNYR